MSKAWICHNEESCIAEVVFADTRGKAKSYFKNLETFDYYTYCELRPRRKNSLDYLDKPEGYVMNWNNQEDRIALVKELGWYCEDPTIEECKKCLAKEYCEEWE